MNRGRHFFLFFLFVCFVVVLFNGQSQANIVVKSTPLQMEPEKVKLSPIDLE